MVTLINILLPWKLYKVSICDWVNSYIPSESKCPTLSIINYNNSLPITGHSLLHIIQLCILLGHMFINSIPVFFPVHHNAEYWDYWPIHFWSRFCTLYLEKKIDYWHNSFIQLQKMTFIAAGIAKLVRTKDLWLDGRMIGRS